jgi:hypothetical protein
LYPTRGVGGSTPAPPPLRWLLGGLVTSLLTALLLSALSPALAATPAEILAEVKAANESTSSIQKVQLQITGKSGSTKEKELQMKAKVVDGLRLSHVRVLSPSDEAGTEFLQLEKKGAADEVWTFIPAMKTTMGISGAARKGAFMGSDFTYEDLELDPDLGTHTLVSEDDSSWVIETVPGDSKQYGKLVSTVDKGKKVATKVEFFDTKGEPFKVLEVVEFAEEGGRTLAKKSVMRNLKKGTSSTMLVVEQRLDVGDDELPADAFTKAALGR